MIESRWEGLKVRGKLMEEGVTWKRKCVVVGYGWNGRGMRVWEEEVKEMAWLLKGGKVFVV